MSYQVLARKWRPRRFADLVGQAHVARALINALDNDRLHHAFLFTGTRGVGKTTIARILAKSLNCEHGVSSTPCGECQSCREVDEGRFVDLIEVDAASRTKVDDTRELLDNVQYAPTRGRYKVYLIDEVHMLSGHSFNALLKTLEEPPPHVKFLLATTDPQRLPVTVLSRCLQFHLKRLPADQIEGQLTRIADAESIGHDAAAIGLLARSADGSLRDALSLLDQAVAFGGGKVLENDVRDMLGSIDDRLIDDLLDALSTNSGDALLKVAADAYERNADPETVLASLLATLHRVAVLQQVPVPGGSGAPRDSTLQRHADALTPEDVQLFYQMALLARRDMPWAPDGRVGLEMALLRMLAFRPAGETDAVVPGSPAPARESRRDTASPSERVRDLAANLTGAGWNDLVARLGITALTRELAVHSQFDSFKNDRIDLTLDQAFAHLHSKDREMALGVALSAELGRTVTIRIATGPANSTPAREKQRLDEGRLKAATESVMADPGVRQLQEEFNARVNPASIQPK